MQLQRLDGQAVEVTVMHGHFVTVDDAALALNVAPSAISAMVDRKMLSAVEGRTLVSLAQVREILDSKLPPRRYLEFQRVSLDPEVERYREARRLYAKETAILEQAERIKAKRLLAEQASAETEIIETARRVRMKAADRRDAETAKRYKQMMKASIARQRARQMKADLADL